VLDSSLNSIQITQRSQSSTGPDTAENAIHLRATNSGAFASVFSEDIDDLFKPEFSELLDRATAWSINRKQINHREVLVLMPFAETFDKIYESGIKWPLERIHLDRTRLVCNRADKIQTTPPGMITEEVFRRIKTSWLLIADLTPDRSDRHNPNVCFEVGYAFGMGKQIILLTTRDSGIPFNL
jgi:hypothetical protein